MMVIIFKLETLLNFIMDTWSLAGWKLWNDDGGKTIVRLEDW